MRTQLAGEDSAWLHMDRPENPMVISALLELGAPLPPERLRALLRARLLEIPRFRQRVIEPSVPGETPSWEDDATFDLDAHVHWERIDAGEHALREATARHVSGTLPRDRPLWRMYVLEREGAGPVLLCRIHHAIADGFALLGVLLSLCDDSSGGATVRFQVDSERMHGGAAVSKAARRLGAALLAGVQETAQHPGNLLELAQRGMRYGAACSRLLTLPPDPQTVLRGPLGVEKRVAWSRLHPLDRVKAVGRAQKATINDVMVSAIAGGLRRYLAERGESVDALAIRAMVPVNLRPLDQPLKLGNHFGLVVLDLAIAPREAVERLHQTKQRMDAIKRSAEAVVGMAIVGAMGFLPRSLESIGVLFFTHKSSMVLTNVAGPRVALSVAGCPIERMSFWVPQSGDLGLGLSIFSYRGEISVGVMSDVGRVPDPERLVEAIEAELSALGV